MNKTNNFVQDDIEKKKKRKRWGLIGALIGLGATTVTGMGLTIYYATRPTTRTYTVTIKNISGATIYGGAEQRVVAGTLIGQLPTPYKSDMVFSSWQDSSKHHIPNTTPINSDMEVYATWVTPTLDAHTVTFDTDGGTLPGLTPVAQVYSIKVNDKTLVGKLPSPIKTGYVFDHWTKDGEKIDFTTEITSNITIKANYKSVSASATVSGGSRLLEFKSDATGQDATAWVLKDAGGTTRTSVEWTIVNKTGGAAITGLTIGTDGKVNWANVAKGSYTAVIKGVDKDDPSIYNSTEIGIVVTDHTYALSGGTTQCSAKLGVGGSAANAWALKKDTTETVTTGITWTVTKADGTATEASITAPDGKLTWTTATPKGNYDLKIHATVGSTDVAQANVGLIITENAYTLTGGSRGFTVKPSQSKTDTNVWKLTKDTAAVTTPSLSITDITPALSGGSITINDGAVTVANIPEGTYTFNVAATDGGQIVIKEQVSVISTETYSIKYGDGTKGSSLTIKDNVTAVDTNGFTLLDSASATQTATWELTKPTTLSDAQLHWDTTNTNKLSYANVPTGTYNLTISAKIGTEVKATIPFTLTSQDTKISLVIAGADTIKTGDGLTSAYDTNLTDKSRVSWAIDSWTPTIAGATTPTISTVAATGVCTVTVVNQLHPEGTLTLKATDSISGQTATKAITITKPYTESSKVFTYDTTNQWCTVLMTDLAGTGNITKTKLDGTALAAITRTTFNDAVYIGDKVVMISDNFLDGCTAFNSEITFDTAAECAVIGNDFLSGCIAFNQTFTIPATVQMIGDSFFNNCQAFNTAITIPATVTKVGNDFMYNCYAMTATITINTTAMAFEATGAVPLTLACDDYSKACYATGMTIAGSDVANFKLLFPNITATTAGVVCRNIL